MKKYTVFAFVFITILTTITTAQKPESFDEAKTLSAQQNKPLLLEFFSEG